MLLAGCGPEPEPEQTCNGAADLCGRAVDEVAWLRAHNAHSSEERGYHVLSTNHYFAIPTQLEDGVRALNIDVYEQPEGLYTCHGYCDLGRQPLTEVFAEMTDFLAGAPDNVILLDLQNEANKQWVVTEMEGAGLASMAHVQVPGEPWPTLRELIDAGSHFVILADGDEETPAWFHNTNSLVYGTGWAAATPEDLTCEVSEPIDHGLLGINNVLTDPIASPDLADLVNHNPDMIDRLRGCEAELGHLPNLVSVDFYSIGDTLEAVDLLNGIDFAE